MGLRDIIDRIFGRTPPSEEPRPDVTAEPEEPPIPEKSDPEPEKKPAPIRYWDTDMIPRVTGPGETIEHKGGGYRSGPSVRLEWVSRQTDEGGKPLRVRTPEGRTQTMPRSSFTAMGKKYTHVSHLVAHWLDGPGNWATDRYGRFVLMVAERFPCFDSSDYLYEDRYFRWFLLCEDGKLTCVCYTDKTDTVTVTEDVLDLETICWKEINRLKCFEEDTDA